MVIPDGELLRRYGENQSEEAFAELVRRHVDLVYSAALRQLNGDAHLAQDVAQNVFGDLARKVSELSSRRDLAGWLYTSTHFAATKVIRTESRRRVREQEAQAMHNILESPAPKPDWTKLQAVLDEAMHELNETEREAVLLRYFQNQQHALIGEKLGLSENAARMRIDRAVEKLRDHLTRRGITATTAALSVVISANAVQTAPVGLIAIISTAAALTGTTLATTATVTAAKTIAMTTMQKIVLTSALAAAAAVGIYEASKFFHKPDPALAIQQSPTPEDDEVAKLAAENARLSNQLAQTASKDKASDQFIELLKLRSKTQLNAQEIAELKAALAGQNEKIPDSIAAIMKKMLASSLENTKQAQRSAMTAYARRLAPRLGLTTEQHEQIRALLLANDDARVALDFALAIGTLTEADVARREKLDQDEARGIAAILTPEQQIAYEKMKSAEATANRKRWAATEAENLKGYLNLTADQTKQVNSILVDLPAGAGGLGMNDYPNPKEQLELRLKAFEPALTPEQIQTYRKRKGDLLDRIKAEKAQYAKIVKALSQ